MANIDNLNFKVILDDAAFTTKVQQDIALAKQLNTQLTALLNVKARVNNMSAKDAATAKRQSDVAAKQAINQEKIKRATNETALSQQKLATETQRTEAATNRAAAAAQRHKLEVQRTATEVQRTEAATNRAALSQQRLSNASASTTRNINSASAAARKMNVSFSQVTGSFMQLMALGGMVSLIQSIVRITGEFELQKATLAAMLDDLGAAEHLLTKIKALAVESPFTFKELGGYAKQLTAFAIPKEELYETTKMLADLSAGLGVSADRLILAYGQVKSAAFLRGQEVRQFTEAGIPILQELAKEFEKLEGRAVSVGEVFDRISTRQVSFEMVAKVLRDMTSEGGKFFNMQQVQANTLWGKMSKLKDQWQIALDEMGKKNGTFIHNTIDGLIDLVKNWETVGKVLRTVIIAFGAYKAALLATWVIQKAMMVYKLAAYFVRAAMGVNTFAAACRAASVSMSGVLGFIGAIGGAIYALSTNSNEAAESTYDLNAELSELHDDAIMRQHSFDADIRSLQSLTKGTQAYRDALEKINEEYGEYLPRLLTERDGYEAIEEAAGKARHAIIEMQRQKAIDSMREEVSRIYEGEAENYNKVMSRLTESGFALFNNLVKRGKILRDEADALTQSQLFGASWITEPGKALSVSVEEFRRAVNYLLHMQEQERKIAERIDMLYDGSDYSTMTEFNIVKAAQARKEASIKALKEEGLAASEYRERELQLTRAYYNELIAEFKKIKNFTLVDKYKKELEELENFEKSWRGKTQKLLKNRGYGEYTSFGLWPTEYTSSTDFIDKIVKDYKEVTDNLDKLHFDPNTEKSLKEQKEVIEAIADLLNIDLTTGKRKGSGGKSELEKKIDALSALKKAYDSLKELNLGDATIIKQLKGAFPDIKKTYGDSFIEALDFTNRILEFGTELKATEPDRANSLLQSLGLDNLSNDKKVISDAIDAAKKYFEAIRKWKTSDFSIEGEGVAFDIGKIANQLSTKFNEIELNSKKITETFNQIDLSDPTAVEAVKNTFEKEFGKGSWDTFYEEYMSKGKQAIEDFAALEKEYERKIAQERLNDIASKHVKEALENIDLSHWGEKSINQIEAIRQRIADLMKGGIELPESTVDELNRLGLTTDTLIEKIRELFGEKYDTATIEKFKALSKVINETVSIAKTLGSDLEKLGDTLDDDLLRGLGKSLQTFEQLTKILTECDSLMQSIGNVTAKTMDDIKKEAEEVEKAKLEGTFESVAASADLMTLAFKLSAMLVSKVIGGINESQEALVKARDAAIEYQYALNQIEYKRLIESHEGIFGTDEYRQAVDAMKEAARYQKAAVDATKEIKTTAEDIDDYFKGMSGWASFSKEAQKTASVVKELGLGDILVDARTAWQKFWGTGNELVKSINIADFIDEEGMLKGEELRAWMKENGEHISQDNKDMLNQMLNDYDLYTQAVEDATAYLSNVFGNVADDMADKFIEAFKASGEAALDYADIMDDVATQIAKSVIKSILIDNIFNEKKAKEVADLFLGGDKVGALEVVDEAMKAAQALTPEIQALLEELRPYFQMEGEKDGSLASGIKGMTEDTANLLASYLNAIRADVSYSRTLWEKMDANTQQIVTILSGFSAPTLIDYQKRIEANTADIAFNTQRILSELQSVITSEGGATAIRTYA